MKSEILNIRISPSLKRELEIMAGDYGVKISDLVRDILEFKIAEEKSPGSNDSQMDSLRSDDFLWLAFWIFQKQYHPFETPPYSDLDFVKKTLVTVMSKQTIPEEVRHEFEKIFQDVVRFHNEPNYPNKSFRFCTPNNYESINYQLLINFLMNYYRLVIIYQPHKL